MMPHDEDAKRLSKNTLSLGEFLTEIAEDYEPPKLDRKVIVHGHCQGKATVGMTGEQNLMEKLGRRLRDPGQRMLRPRRLLRLRGRALR